MKSNFSFLESQYPELSKLGILAERNVFQDPSTSLAKLRIFTEKLSKIIAEFEDLTEALTQDQVGRLNTLKEEGILPEAMLDIFHKIRKSGNKAAHDGVGTSAEARFMLRQTFHILQWFYTVYEGEEITQEYQAPVETADDSDKIKELEAQLANLKKDNEAYLQKVKELSEATPERKEERRELGVKLISKLEKSEVETRELIDQQLRDAGWECATAVYNFKSNKTLPQKGRNLAIAEWKCGSGWADYALFLGEELVGLVEAKKIIKNVSADIIQAKRYSTDVLEENQACFIPHPNDSKYKVPFMFATNGRPYLEQMKTSSGIWFWDGRDQRNPASALSDWFTPRDLREKLIFNAQQGAEKLKATGYELLSDSQGLNLREYQVEAIKAVENKILSNFDDRRALLAMATGTGKTRTILGMCYRLIQAGRFRRILFLVDRKMLGQQAADAFAEVKVEGLQTFAQIYDIKNLEDAAADLDTKIHFATVQSMVSRIAYSDTPPSVGDYDCIIVDEAHRGYTLDREMEEEEIILRDQFDYQSKYRLVLDYFDAYRIGLTATPATHTEEIFGKPVFTYSYRRAVVEGYLIDFEPPYVFQTRLSKEGIVWEKGDPIKVYDPEENSIVEAGVADDELKVDVAGFNKKVISPNFNKAVLGEIVSSYGIHPEDKKKTLIFAANDRHADEVVDILYQTYRDLGEEIDSDAIVKITGSVRDREHLLRKFKTEQYPSIVVTVDLLTTGIDVPSITHLVFLRQVNSRILYDQMLGRATRRCDDIGKEAFYIYDCVGVTVLMMQELVMKPVAPSVSKSFGNLVEELSILKDEYLKEVKLDRILAKLQRKLNSFTDEQMERFTEYAKESSKKDFFLKLRATDPDKLVAFLEDHQALWDYLDREKGKAYLGQKTLFSDHEDDVQEVTRAYDKNLKPKDYIESFNEYIRSNVNEIAALKLLCTKPASLTRKDLKELRLLLEEKGYSNTSLNTAWNELTNQYIVADIIAHIRTAALGTSLVGHHDRIRSAVKKLRDSHEWNQIQLKWLDKIEAQLLRETILTVEDLNKPPFSEEGGEARLNKVFKEGIGTVLDELNDYLYQA